MRRGFPLPPSFFPIAAFVLWFYLFWAGFEAFLSYTPFQKDLLAANFYIVDLILVLSWFSLARQIFFVFAGAVLLIASYLFLYTGDEGLLVQNAAVCLISGWLFFLTRQAAIERLRQVVAHEKVRSQLNLAALSLKEKEHLLNALKKKIEHLTYLREFSDRLKEIIHTKKCAEMITQEAAKMFPQAVQALLYLIDEKSRDLGLVHHVTRDKTKTLKDKKGDEFDLWVLRRSQPLLIEDVSTDFRFSYEPGRVGPMRSVCLAPLVSERKVFGVLRLNAAEPGAFKTEDLRLLDFVADLSSVSLRNALLFEKTKELSIIDSLTECYLLRYIQERLAEEIRRSLRTKQPFAVMMVDIDHFKDYNDQYGHTAGDIVLKTIAEILKTSVGAGDIVGRYGGEEFVCLSPGKNLKEAFDMAEELRKKVESKDYFLRKERQKLTISIGVSVFPEGGGTPEELLWKADQNLYKAKRGGRNRTVADR